MQWAITGVLLLFIQTFWLWVLSLSLSLCCGQLNAWGALTAILGSLSLTFLCVRSRWARHFDWVKTCTLPPLTWIEKGLTVFYMMLALRVWLWITFVRDGQIMVQLAHLHPEVVSQWWGSTQYLVSGFPVTVQGFFQALPWVSNTPAQDYPLFWPMGLAFIVAPWLKLGMATGFVLPLMGLLYSAALWVVLMAWGRGLALLLFMTSPGLAGWLYFSEGSVHELLKKLSPEMVAQAALPWMVWLLDPTYVIAFPCGLLLLWLLRQPISNSFAPLLGLLLMVLAGFNGYAYVVVALLGFWLAIHQGKRILWQNSLLWSLPGLFPLLWVTLLHGWLGAIDPGWLFRPHHWGLGLGLTFGFGLLIAIALGSVIVQQKQYALARLFVLPALLLLTIPLLIRLSNWPVDTLAVMSWGYLFLIPSLGPLLIETAKPWMKGLLVVECCLSGLLLLWHQIYWPVPGDEIIKKSSYFSACASLKEWDVNGPLWTYPQLYHPARLCGYRLQVPPITPIYSQKKAYDMALARLNRFFKTGQAPPEAKSQKHIHVVWSESDRERYQCTHPTWLSNRDPDSVHGWAYLYKLHPKLKEGSLHCND